MYFIVILITNKSSLISVPSDFASIKPLTLFWLSHVFDIWLSEIGSPGLQFIKLISTELQWWQEVHYILFCLITPTNIGQISKSGTVSESARPEDSKTVTGS